MELPDDRTKICNHEPNESSPPEFIQTTATMIYNELFIVVSS